MNFRARETLTFIALAMGLAWIVASPLWIDDRHLEAPFATPLMVVMMFTPSLAVLITHLIFRPGDLKETLAVRLGERRVGLWIAAVTLPFFGGAVALLLAAAAGVYTFDAELSALQQYITELAGEDALAEVPFSFSLLAFVLPVQMLVGGIINAPVTLGEELGWRGYLLPRLLPLGKPAAIGISGVVWGVWHAPVILLGYNYPEHPVLGVALFIVTCTLLGGLLAGLRLATNSVWPAALAHGAVNAAGGMPLAYALADAPRGAVHVGITGWTGWLVMLAMAAVVLWRTRGGAKVAVDAAVN